jgi:hypothetical protein
LKYIKSTDVESSSQIVERNKQRQLLKANTLSPNSTRLLSINESIAILQRPHLTQRWP